MYMKKRLSITQEKQLNNEQNLRKYKCFEEEYGAFERRESRLFDWLFDVWSEDDGFRITLEQNREELHNEKRKVLQHLDENKQSLLREKEDLEVVEQKYFDALLYSRKQEDKS